MAVSKPHLLFQVPLQINFMRKTFLVLRYAVRGSFVVHIIIINFGFNCFMFVCKVYLDMLCLMFMVMYS